jgi:hypothetical protein
MLLPAAVIFLGFIVTLFLVAPNHLAAGRAGGSH